MIELFIENVKIDLTDNLEISFNYETIDPDKLSNIKNSFSKTVNIPGTPNNNKAFGYIFRYDKHLKDESESNIMNDYDPHKKANWFINKNGKLIQRGYCTLDNIITKNDYEVTYHMTLYGGLGEFFYSLSYNEDGSPKTLVDLFWNWTPMHTIEDISIEPPQYTDINPHAWLVTSPDRWIFSSQYDSIMYDVSNINQILFVVRSVSNSSYYGFLRELPNNHQYPVGSAQMASGETRRRLGTVGNIIVNVPEDAKYLWVGLRVRESISNISTFNYLDPEKESTEVLYVANAANIARSYSLLDPFYNYEGLTPICRDVVFVPTYQGLYEDFDSKHMLVSTRMQNDPASLIDDTTKNRLLLSFPSSFTKDEKTYTTLNSDLNNEGLDQYGLVEFSRDLDPWEAGELRVKEMPIAIRLSKMMQTISNPDNNGGYEVEWDESIKNSFYWNYGWVMLPPLKTEKKELESYDITLPTQTRTLSVNYNYTTQDADLANSFEQQIFNGSVDQGTFQINLTYDLQSRFKAGNTILDNPNNIVWDSYGFEYSVLEIRKIFNVWASVLEVREDGVISSIILDLITINNSNFLSLGDDEIQHIKATVETYYRTSLSNPDWTITEVKSNNIKMTGIKFEDASTSTNPPQWAIGSSRLEIQHNIEVTQPSTIDIHQYMFTCWMYSDALAGSSKEIQSGIYRNTAKPHFDEDYMNGFMFLYNQPLYSLIWDRADSDNLFDLDFNLTNLSSIKQIKGAQFKATDIHKKELFAQSESPMKYLSGFCKLLNYRFITDNISKKIWIKELRNYYQDSSHIFDLTDKVDLGRDISITPVTAKYKNIEIGFDTPMTYPVELFNKNSKDKFNTLKYITNVEYPLENSTLLNDLVFNNTIDWQQNSIYYNIHPQFPKAYNTATISWNLFSKGETNTYDIQSSEQFTLGAPSIIENLTPQNDVFPKNSLFNRDDKITDFDSSLLFLNGFVKNYDVTKTGLDFERQVPFNGVVHDTALLAGGVVAGNQYTTMYTYDITPSSNYYITIVQTKEPSEIHLPNDAIGVAYYNDDTFISTAYTLYDIYSSTDHMLDKVKLENIPSNANNVRVVLLNNLGETWNYQYGFEVFKLVTVGGNQRLSPRTILTNDTYTQYYLNQERCYEYDFSYDKNFYGWGYTSKNENGSASSWVIPFFTKDLYNGYTSTYKWGPSGHILASWNIVKQDGLDKTYKLDDTTFIVDPTFEYNALQANSIAINDNEWKYGYFPSDISTSRIYTSKWENYLDDLYDRNARDVTLYADLTKFGDANDIMRHIYRWKGNLWIITKIHNYKISNVTKDNFTKITIHKIDNIYTWTTD